MEQLMGNPTAVSVTDVVKENKYARTLVFEHPAVENIHPGQFLMVWIPGVDEIPMSVSLLRPPLIGITVLPIGEATNALASMQKGQRIGIRGPFGTYFDSDCKSALVVGGGIGMAPLRPLTYELLDRGVDVVLLNGAKTKDELVYTQEFEALTINGFNLELSTDDGSAGFEGLATDAAKHILSSKTAEVLYTCGPELMLSGLHKLATEKKMGFQASLERFMKCGCGLCGTCAMDPTGDLVCIDGPVFNRSQLERITEFGEYHRDSMGLKKEC
ncbi:MAG: dihydroorotate dehydrogenase electron transfer subunit [Candidatus Thorarchaeota archaeon SMTZ1-83]